MCIYLYVSLHYSCDRQFLGFSQRYIIIPALVGALKVMFVLGEHRQIYNVDNDGLSDFAKHILKQICSQTWIQNRCLQVSTIHIANIFRISKI